MRTTFACLTFTCCAALAAAQQPAPAHFERELPPTFRYAQDIRWAGPDLVYVSDGRDGVYEISTASKSALPRRVMNGGTQPDGFFFASRLAVTPTYTVTASPLAALAWMRRPPEPAQLHQVSYSTVVDIDARGNQAAILGANRDDKGVWSPDGAIAWIGSLDKNLADLHAIHLSAGGAGAKTMAFCHYLESGGVRFLPDGSLIVVPGVDPGVYLYDAEGHLKRTWDTGSLGYYDRCTLTVAEFKLLSANGVARAQWVNQHTVIDDVVAIGDQPALIARTWKDGHVSWQMLRLLTNGQVRRVDLPYTSPSPDTHLRADVRQGAMALLFFEFAEAPEAKSTAPTRLVVQPIQ